jgi:excisionase family DNA binding protein
MGRQSSESDPPNGELMTVKEVAALLRRHPQTVYAWAAAGKLPPCYRIEGRIFFSCNDIRRWVLARKVS